MALSGTITKNVNSYWRLRLHWTATQDEANNRSTITSKLYWESTSSSYGAVYSSASKSGSQKIHNSSSSFSSTAGLSNGQSKLIDTHTGTVTHNSNGDLSVGLSASFGINITLSGTYYGTVSLSGTARLDTIARKSTLSGNESWIAGNDRTFSINRASSNFRHELEIYVKNRSGSNVHIKRVDYSTSQTSRPTNFSTADHQQIYDVLDGRSSAPTYLILQTYNGSTWIGSNYYSGGTVTAENASYPAAPSSFNIGDSFKAEAKYYNAGFNHTIRLKNGSTVLKTYSNVIRSTAGSDNDMWVNFDTSSIAGTLYGLVPTSTSINLTLEVITYMGNEEVRSSRSKTITARVVDSNPSFSGSPTYADINSTTTAITGNNQYIISTKSKVRVTLSSTYQATAQNGATMKTYSATLGGKTISKSYSTSTLTFDFNEISASTNQTVVINAIDSRGKSSSITKTVIVIPYNLPTLAPVAERVNGFEADTTLKLTGSVSPLKVGTTNKNSISTARYRTKLSTSSTWTAYANFSISTSNFPKFTATNVTKNLDNLNSFHVEFQVTDKLGTTTIIKTVSTGRPLFFLDDNLLSVGFGDFPSNSEEIMIAKRVRFASNQYNSAASAGEAGGGAMDMGNSDIVGINGLFFNDLSSNRGEGLLFPNTGTPSGSTDNEEYTNFYMRDNIMFINSQDVLRFYDWDSNGHAISIGAGGLTVIGGGESSYSYVEGRKDAGLDLGSEDLYLTADGFMYINAGMQGGYGTGKEWVFDSSGNIRFPNNGAIEMDGYGNIKAVSNSGSWSVHDRNGDVQLRVPLSGGNNIIDIGQFQLDSQGGGSALVFRAYTSTNKEFIWVRDDTNGFYFNADQDVPSINNTGTGNGNLFAAKYNVVSDEEQKEEISEFTISALSKVRNSKTYQYDHKMSDFAKARAGGKKMKKSLGLIAQEAPSEITTDEGLGVDLYAMNTMLWKAVQELADQVEYLEKKIKKK